MRVDTHVHTSFSGNTTLYPLKYLLRESYNSPEGVYRRAKARGMDLVAITDHDTIAGALTIADRPDVLVGCEVTASFPEDGVRVHLGVLGVTEVHHREMQRLRGNIRELLQYLNREELFVSLNHVASRINGDVTAAHIAQIMPWINGIEVRNGSRLPVQNRTALALSEACRKVPVAGSDSHTRRGHRPDVRRGAARDDARRVPDRARRGPRPASTARRALLHDGVRHRPHRAGFYQERLGDVGAHAAELADARHRRRRARRAAAAGVPLVAGGRALHARGPVQPSLLFDLVARPAGTGGGAMNVAIFTDNDFAKVNGVTTSLRAAIRYAPAGIHRAIYTASDLAEDRDDYFSTAAVRHAHAVLRRHADVPAVVPHAPSPGPRGPRRPAALHHARPGRVWRRCSSPGGPGSAMVGSFHTDLAAYTERLSGFAAARRADARVPALAVRPLRARLRAVREHARAARRRPHRPVRIDLWTRGVDTELFAPQKRSTALRERWRVCDQPAGGDLRRPAVEGEGPAPAARRDLAMLPARRGAPARPRRGRPVSARELAGGAARRRLHRHAGAAEVADGAGVRRRVPVPERHRFGGQRRARGAGLRPPDDCVRPRRSARIHPSRRDRSRLPRPATPKPSAMRAAQLLSRSRRRRAMGEAARRHAATLGWDAALAPLYRAYLEVGDAAPSRLHAPPDRIVGAGGRCHRLSARRPSRGAARLARHPDRRPGAAMELEVRAPQRASRGPSIFFAANVTAGWRAAVGRVRDRAGVSRLHVRLLRRDDGGVRAGAARLGGGASATMVLLPVLSHTPRARRPLSRAARPSSRAASPRRWRSPCCPPASTCSRCAAARSWSAPGRGSLADDLRRTPRLIGAFVLAVFRAAAPLCRHRRLL